MKELHSEIEIDASAQRVWDILTDFASYPQWNPFIRRIRGDLEVGKRLEVRLEPPDSRGITMRPTVLRAEPNRLMRWVGHLFFPGIFDGEHTLAIHLLEGDRVRFVQHEAFKGVLVRLLARSLDKNTLRGFEEMNEALKERAEALSERTDLRPSENLHG